MNSLIAFLSSTALLATPAFSAVVMFTPIVDSDNEANTSATTPYGANNTVQGNADGGWIDNSLGGTNTFFFADTTTGIEFSFDITYSATSDGTTAANINNNSTVTGVGSNTTISGTETITLGISNFSVDTSGYVSGSVGGLAGPVSVATSSLTFSSVNFADWTADATAANVTDGTNTTVYSGSSVIDFLSPADRGSLPDPTVSPITDLTFSHNAAASTETDFNIAATSFLITVDVVPEPSSALLASLSLIGLLRRRR